MKDQRKAVKLILDHLRIEGLDWHRTTDTGGFPLSENRGSGRFSTIGEDEIHKILSDDEGSFPKRKILPIKPPIHRKKVVELVMWLRWNFDKEPADFGLFLGQWAEVAGQQTFIAFRFETPGEGNEHDYFHCQPCRNIGDREPLQESVHISERSPTIPLNASNIVELTVCAVMAAQGRANTQTFIKGLTHGARKNKFLSTAYTRCCEKSFVDLTVGA